MTEINELIVAAIDIGTTYSSYAYSFKGEYLENPLKVYSNAVWTNEGLGGTQKTPTVVLFDTDGEFHSFGYEAENKYTALINEDNHQGWRYFRRFKMMLAKKNVQNDVEIEDHQGQRMKALDVFAASIKFMKDHALTPIRKRLTDLKDTEIRWVLTVPAIWDEAAKKFMIAAAELAGIPRDNLVLAYEPAAAAMYCKERELAETTDPDRKTRLQSNLSGLKFMVLDLGGGTVDIMAFEMKDDNSLQSIIAPSGGPWGGIIVDRYFVDFIEKLFGKHVFGAWSEDHKAHRLDLERVFERKKRTIKGDDMTIKIPSTIYETYQRKEKQNFFASGKRSQTVSKHQDKMQIKSSDCIAWFKESQHNLLTHVKKLLQKPEMKELKMLVMVGGFSDSQVIQEAVKKTFSDYEVIVPSDVETSIVIGAVVYGYKYPASRPERMPFSYDSNKPSKLCNIL